MQAAIQRIAGGESECGELAGWICDILDVLAKGEDTSAIEAEP